MALQPQQRCLGRCIPAAATATSGLSEAPSVPVSCRVARQRRARVLRDWLLPRRPGHPRLTARMRGLRHHSAKQPQPQAESTARHFVSSMRQPKASFDHAAVQASQTPVSPRLAIASLPQKSRQNVHSHFCQ